MRALNLFCLIGLAVAGVDCTRIVGSVNGHNVDLRYAVFATKDDVTTQAQEVGQPFLWLLVSDQEKVCEDLEKNTLKNSANWLASFIHMGESHNPPIAVDVTGPYTIVEKEKKLTAPGQYAHSGFLFTNQDGQMVNESGTKIDSPLAITQGTVTITQFERDKKSTGILATSLPDITLAGSFEATYCKALGDLPAFRVETK